MFQNLLDILGVSLTAILNILNIKNKKSKITTVPPIRPCSSLITEYIKSVLPIVGIPMPFVSYGGTSLLSFFTMVGIVNSIHLRRYSLTD